MRGQGLKAEMDLTGKKLKNALRYADAAKIRYVAVVGDQELQTGQIELKEMATGTIQTLSIDRIVDALQKNTSLQ